MSFLFGAAGQSKNLHPKRKIVLISIISNSGASCVGGSIFARSLNVDFFWFGLAIYCWTAVRQYVQRSGPGD